jgi:UDP-N-acetyl-D-glucosamine dehydrogenase
MDCVSICVPTPLRKTRDPDISYVLAAADQIGKYAHPDMLVVLESTTYPGTTEEILLPRLEERGCRVGKEVFLAFSPERIDPGNPTYGVRNTPKVVGGLTPECTDMAVALYRHIVDTVVPVSSTKVAEMVKLLENTFRMVNIGLVNEVALMCDRLDIDVWEVIRAAATKPFGFQAFYPGPGLGGHCIPLDPIYLSWKLKTLNYTARFIELASEINTAMPLHVISLVAASLNDDRKAINGSRILVLGVAYKRNVSDMRESPALDIIQLLQQRGAQVRYHDPLVPILHVESHSHLPGAEPLALESVPLTAQELAKSDCVVIVTDHSTIDWDLVVAHAPLIVDSRNACRGKRGPGRVVKL